jgi:hypothetical protein
MHREEMKNAGYQSYGKEQDYGLNEFMMNSGFCYQEQGSK